MKFRSRHLHGKSNFNQLQQLVAGAAQLGAAQGAAQLGAHDEAQPPQHFGFQQCIFGMQSFGILILQHRILWQQPPQQLATGAQQVVAGAQAGAAQAGAQAGAAQVGAQVAAGAQAGAAQAGAQAGAAQAGAHAGAAHDGAQAGAAQLGAAEQQLLQWWNRPA